MCLFAKKKRWILLNADLTISDRDQKNINIQELKKIYQISESLEKLDNDLIGLESVKKRIREITAILFMDKIRQDFGLSKYYPGLHMSFTGSPGTGKSTVASRMAELLQKLGYLTRGHLVVVSRDDLVAQFVGQTAPKTKDVLEKSMGGVLLIDEAYYLYKPNNEKDYGGEAIEMLLQVMENKRTDLVLIFAGYSEPMKVFYRSNPGLSSRVAHHIDFPDYTRNELLTIAKKLFQERQYQMSFYTEQVLVKYLDLRRQLPLFANARSIKNIVSRACFRLASRVMTYQGVFTYKNLIHITPSDLMMSTLFLKGLHILPLTKIGFLNNSDIKQKISLFQVLNYGQYLKINYDDYRPKKDIWPYMFTEKAFGGPVYIMQNRVYIIHNEEITILQNLPEFEQSFFDFYTFPVFLWRTNSV